jgi:uncharacterized protein (DUF362 family)
MATDESNNQPLGTGSGPVITPSSPAGLVTVLTGMQYQEQALYDALPRSLFSCIEPFHRVVLKPNWVRESHLKRLDDWDYVITHPTLITAVLRHVVERLDGRGSLSVLEGPQTDSSFSKIIARYPVREWEMLCAQAGVRFQVIDLRDNEWVSRDGVVIDRLKLKGDPMGKVEINLKDELSEFFGHKKSKRGYYGADYDMAETNRAHNGSDNLYSVSKTVIDCDVFINLPKLKTHKKAGITSCLKNLVGINTYKNFLPHHSEGDASEGGDQFRGDRQTGRLEGSLVAFLKQNVLRNPVWARLLSPFKALGYLVFGETKNTVRSGNWYGNDTVWRMILDLNKILLYANPDGTLRPERAEERKKYIGIVDAVIAGQGNGPMEPDPLYAGFIICGGNPVSIDAVCAAIMGFDPARIPSIARAFGIARYKLTAGALEDIVVSSRGERWGLADLPADVKTRFKPHFGWVGHIEGAI